ncbi:unnamed protein product [Cylindrotheca closterium]|uniref:Uncharacterized protein n=1 Tax=Cylindrotheca closterium TaxID=2856 RepID=A0AAD2GD88_9STRA|nr:unnamed protein product [Cylindrotheca closterium]
MQTFPPRTLDAILQVGRSALTTVKDLPLDTTKENLLLSNYFHTHAASECKNILLSQAHGFAYFDGADGTLRQVICAKQVGPNLHWASANDSYDAPTPVAFSLDALGSSVISIARDDLARECQARHLHDAQYSAHTALAPDITDPPEDIHWPSGDGVFTEVKKFFPIYPGANIPPSLTLSAAPPANLESFHPQFRLWYEAMKYLHDHNDSQSLHSHAHIFSADTIPTDRFPDSDLATHLTYSPSTVSAFAAEVPTYKALFEEFKRHSALSTLASTNHVTTQEAPAAPLPAGAPFDSELFAQIMANALKGTNASTKEKDLARTSASAKDSFSLIFGRVKPVIQLDGSTVNEFHPSVLTDDFVTFLEISSIKEALRHLHDTFAHITDTLTTRNNYDRNVDFDIALFQHATVTALKTCSFGVRPLTMHPHEATSLLSLLAWLPPNKNDVRYTTFLSEGRDIIRQEAMEEDKSKQAAKKTDIFVHGDVSSVEALIKMLANFFAFVKYCVKDFTFDDPPLIVTLLEDFQSHTSHCVSSSK